MNGAPSFGAELCAIARASVAHAARHGTPGSSPDASRSPRLAEQRASFVTLHLEGRLRGCIGSLQANRPVAEDVHMNAWAAACRDSRFPPVSADEVPRLALHISVLGALEALPFDEQAGLLASLRPGRDGLLIRLAERQATFLPTVWEQLPDPASFLAALKQKAGLPASAIEFEAFRYGCEDFDCPPASVA